MNIHTGTLGVLMSACAATHGHHGHHGNPEDLAGYIAKMEDPSRDAWQRPDDVLRSLGVTMGQTICDIGAGSGYFARRLASAVGQTGHVYAVDVEPTILAVLRERIATSGLRNITPVLALPDHVLLPRGACDVILIVDTFHHFPDGTRYLRDLKQALRPSGRIVNIDFHKRELPVGPSVEHLIAREDFLAQAEQAELQLAAEYDFLPYQYFVILQAR